MSIRLYGPFRLTSRGVETHVQPSAGVYALGETRSGTFVTTQIGRSDNDLRSTLKAQVPGSSKLFKFAYAISPLEAFEKECELYHDLVESACQSHPKAPRKVKRLCRWCAAGE